MAHNSEIFAGRVIRFLVGKNIPVNGLSINVSQAPVTHKTIYRLFFDLYERPERNAIEKYLDPSLPVIELGASLGVVTCTIRRKLDPQVPLISLEGNPDLLPQIHHNLARNQMQDNVTLHNLALAYGTDAVQFAIADQTAGSRIVDPQVASGRIVTVESITLSDLIAKHNIVEYTLVSDIEGGEWDMILQDSEALRRCKTLVIELHDKNKSSKEDLKAHITDDLGYQLLDQQKNVYVFSRQ